MTKWIIAIVIVAVVGAGAAWYLAGRQSPPPPPQPNAAAQNPSGMSGAGDTSDQALSQDTAAIDAQIQGLGADAGAADQSLADKPVTQSY
jgi:hypothetical protein